MTHRKALSTTPDFSRSVQTTTLIELLRSASVGELVSYARLSEAIGEDILDCRHYLATAVRALYGEGLPFGTVRGQGVKRLTAEELPAIGEHALHHIRRTSTRARKRMGTAAHMNDVPNDVRVRINASASMLGVIEHFSANRARKAVTEAVTKSDAVIPPLKLLEALK